MAGSISQGGVKSPEELELAVRQIVSRAIPLAMALAVQDIRAQRGGIERRGDGRQARIIDGCGQHLALRAVKPFAQPDVTYSI
jgi:hypothetical protein